MNNVEQIYYAVQILSWPYERQNSYLKMLGIDSNIDEIALTFHEAYIAIPKITIDKINSSQRELLFKINSNLDFMSQDLRFWNLNSLKSDFMWEEVRKLARQFLLFLPSSMQ